MENMEKGVGLLGKLLNLMKKYGFWNIIKSLAVLLMLAYVIFFALNPTYLLDRVARVQEERHTEATAKRIMADKEIQLLQEPCKRSAFPVRLNAPRSDSGQHSRGGGGIYGLFSLPLSAHEHDAVRGLLLRQYRRCKTG